ncbi:MAG: ABC transporter substrate-binding protein [Deltaproteobacteria bacterium]|nr:ABC transporter substrate-binding protein [Deltaproteobacteria bacterium]
MRTGFFTWLSITLCLCIIMHILFVPSTGSSQEYRVGTWKTAQTIQPFFYQDFVKTGELVSVFTFTNPSDQKLALLAGSLDMCGTTLAHAIHAASRGEPVVLVASLCNKCSALVVKKGGPVTAVADLKGRKIGYVPGTMHEILLRETLARHGISPVRDVRLTRVDFFDMGIALARGSIDAFLSGEPFPTLAKVQGYGTILSYPYYEESIGSINAGMLVRRDMIGKHPERVYSLVLAHARATEFLKAHPDEWLKKATEFGTPLEVLKEARPNMELVCHMDESFVEKAKALGERMQALGIINNQPDYETLFDLSFIQRVYAE